MWKICQFYDGTGQQQNIFLVTLYNCACAIHVMFFEITTNAWGEKCWSVHLKFAMVESKHPGYIPVFYSSFFPSLFNCFLFALSFSFLMWLMCHLLLKSTSQEWKWNPAFCITTCKTGGRMGRHFLKKMMSCRLRGAWQMVANQFSIALSYLPLTKTHVASQDTFMFTWQRAHNEKRKQIGVYLRHPSEKTYHWIIAPLYSQVRLWVFLCLLQIILSEWIFGCPKDSAETKWHSWHSWFHEFRLCQKGGPGAIPCIENIEMSGVDKWQVGWYRLASPLLAKSGCPENARARFRGFIGLSCSAFFWSRELFV